MVFTSTIKLAGGCALVLKEDKNSEENEIPSFRLKPSVKTEIYYFSDSALQIYHQVVPRKLMLELKAVNIYNLQ